MPAADEAWVREAIGIAREAAARGDPPFGAVLVDVGGDVVVRSGTRQVSGDDPTAHAEIELLRAAARAGIRTPMAGYTIVVNAEPCSMCASAIVKAEADRLVFGARHEPHMDPDLDVATVFARSRRPPAMRGGVLAEEAALQIASAREGETGPPID